MGNEFRVNHYSDNFQLNPDVAHFSDGGFLVVWNSYFNQYDGTPSATYLASQRYDANGRPVGSEQVVFVQAYTSSYDPSVTVLSDGGYVVLWEYDDYDDILTLKKHVFAQVHNADGSVRTTAFQVDTVASFDAILPEAFATANGGFRVTFAVDRAGALSDQIYSRLYDGMGTALGPDTLLNTIVGKFDQIYARSAQLADGRTITVWNSQASLPVGLETDSNEVRGTIFSATGQVVKGDFSLCRNIGTVGSDKGTGYDVAALADGGFVVSRRAFGSDVGTNFLNSVVIESFDANGRATVGPFLAFSSDEVIYLTRVIQLDSGEIVVVWEQQPDQQGKFGEDVVGRLFAADGTALTNAFLIGKDRFNFDSQTDPEIVALAGGGFVVTYISDSVDPDGEGIAGRIFGRGTSGADVLSVDQSGTMAGLGGRDALTGNGRSNSLAGGAGSDTLTGGGGADRFVFDGSAGPDRITDFSGVDQVVLQASGFAGLALGRLPAVAFRVIGAGAIDGNDRILYNPVTGLLSYDSNGNAAGGQVAFAQVTVGTVLDAGDFLVI